MILNIPKRLNNIVAIGALSIGLVACGGDGGSAPAASAVVQPVTVVGKLVPDVRSRSFSSTYGTDEDYKNLVDAFLVAMNELVVEIDSVVKWQSDIPVIFSGCGQLNAFFSPEVDLHASFAADGVADPTPVFVAH